jgi:hypothetical protein
MLPLSFALFLIIALVSPVSAEERSACSLLTSSDAESVTGGKIGVSQPLHFDDIPTGPNRIIKVSGCLFSVPTHRGQISTSWMLGPITDDEIAQLIKMSKNNVGVDGLRKANYKEESKDFPLAWCSTFTPPASVKNGMPMSSCSGGVKGHGISITFLSPSKTLTINEAKALFDKVSAHVR